MKVARYRGMDPRDMPAYSVAEAAFTLGLPATTLRQWVAGRWQHRASGRYRVDALVPLPERDGRVMTLSFNNLVECHVLASARRDHKVALASIREALKFLQQKQGVARPFLTADFETDGQMLFSREMGRLLSLNEQGQFVIHEAVKMYLKRIERDPDGLPARFFPFVGGQSADSPRRISIDPSVAFGRPTVAGTGIPAREIAGRLIAGDSVDDVTDDFGISPDQAITALVWQARRQAA